MFGYVRVSVECGACLVLIEHHVVLRVPCGANGVLCGARGVLCCCIVQIYVASLCFDEMM